MTQAPARPRPNLAQKPQPSPPITVTVSYRVTGLPGLSRSLPNAGAADAPVVRSTAVVVKPPGGLVPSVTGSVALVQEGADPAFANRLPRQMPRAGDPSDPVRTGDRPAGIASVPGGDPVATGQGIAGAVTQAAGNTPRVVAVGNSRKALDTTAQSTAAAVPVSAFLASIGVNTHLDEAASPYSDTAGVASELLYLGVGNVRDSMASPNDPSLFANVASAAGVTFDIYISQSSLSYSAQIADMLSNPAILRTVEGANEPDTWTPAITFDGLTGFDATAALQQTLYEAASTLSNVGVIGPSYGVLSDFALASNTSAVSGYGNTHEYFGTGNPPGASLQTLIDDAQLVSGSDPIIATEAGYYTGSSMSAGGQDGVDELVQAKYDLTLLFDDWAAGIRTTYLYELLDEAADPGNTNFQDHYGLYNADGTPKQAAVALHNLTTILADSGSTGRSDPFGYQVVGLPSTGNTLLMEKSTGVFDLAVWNDVRLWSATAPVEIANPAVPITVNFGQLVQSVTEYDPMQGTSAVLSGSDVASITLDIVDHPIILEVTPYPAGAISLSSFVLPETVAAGLTSGQSTADLWSTLIGNATETDPNLLPGVVVSAVGTTATAGHVTFDAAAQTIIYQAPAYDPFNPTDSFSYTLSDGNGGSVTGSVAITETAPPNTSYGTLAGAQVTAPSSGWTLVADAAGETLQGSTLGGDDFVLGTDGTAYAAGPGNTIQGGAGSLLVVAGGNGADIALSGGADTIDAIGDGDSIAGGTGSNTVYVGGNGNLYTAGSGGDTITLVGTGNTVIGGAGALTLTDYGENNTVVLGEAGSHEAQLYGNLVARNDVFDLRPALAATNWDGSLADIGNYLSVTTDGPASIIAIDPDGTGPAPAVDVAILYNTYGLSTAGLLTDSLVPCYCAGTRILTDRGEVRIEELAIGLQVMTVSGVARPIRWIGRRSYDGRLIAGNRAVLPILIAAGALADGIPARDLSVSPKHAMFLDGVLIPAELLVNGSSIVQRRDVAFVTYFHIELESHDIIMAEGAPAESFVDCDNRAMFHNAHEFGPGKAAAAWAFCAPRVEEGEILEAVRRRVAARAGLADPAAPGPLEGRIDVAHTGGILGWAFDVSRPTTPVRLEVFADGVAVGEVIANAYRPDLEEAGKGPGRCAFSFRFDLPLTSDADHFLMARRASDGAALAGLRLAACAGLDGRVDSCTAAAVAGWAVDAASCETPVTLEILDAGRPIGRVLADRYRPDLDRAGRGSCAFLFEFDRTSPPRDPRHIRVRRAGDHAMLQAPKSRHG